MIDDLLSLLRPSADDTALLAGCLKSGEAARVAWEAWCAPRQSSIDTLRMELAARRNLLPLLQLSVRRNGLSLEPVLLDYVRAATLREQLRAERFRSIAARVLSAIEHAGATAYVSRGVALAATAYEDWALRHCHDLDLLVSAEDAATAAAALRKIGLQLVDIGAARRFSVPGQVTPAAVLRDLSGLNIALHTRPFAVPFYDVALARFMEGARCVNIGGQAVRVPSAEALLVHVLAHATYSSTRRNLRWLTDAWHLLHGSPDIDWNCVVEHLDEWRMALPVNELLRYLAQFGMPIPAELMARVQLRAASLPPLARDVAFGGALSAAGGDLAALWRAAPSLRARAHLVRWMVAPSAAYVRSAFPERRSLPIALAYLQRPVRFLRSRRVAASPDDSHA